MLFAKLKLEEIPIAERILELNFFRMPWYFKAGKEKEGTPLMTELVRSAREIVNRASESKSKPVLLGVRTPGTVDSCRRIGLDIETCTMHKLLEVRGVLGVHWSFLCVIFGQVVTIVPGHQSKKNIT